MKKFWYVEKQYGKNMFFYNQEGIEYLFSGIERQWYVSSAQWTALGFRMTKFDSLELMYEHLLEKSDARLIKDFEKYFL